MKYRQVRILQDNGIDIRSIKNQNALARKLGMDKSWLSRVLREKVVASENTYLRIKEALQVNKMNEKE